MASEVQRIIALSLNKIVASRSRRGGVSLHRNLLVASVLLRAKDAYIAETVAKRKKDMDAEAVVPNLECTEASEEGRLSEDAGNMETDSSDQSANISFTCEEKVCQFDEQDCEEPIEDEEFHSRDSELKQIELDVDNSDAYSDVFKENQDPNVSASDSVGRCSSRKRRIHELDSRVLECNALEQKFTDTDCDSSHLNHSDIADNGPNCKYMKFNTSCNIENNQKAVDYSENCELSSCNKISHSDSDICWDFSSNSDYDKCSKSSEEQVNHLLSSYSCPSEQQTFAQQVTLTHTNLLIATM